jgi:glycosyltransferase involved in cell wall biosynthesis
VLGCEGLGIPNGVEALVEDDPVRFEAAIDRLVSDTALCEKLTAAGRKLVEDQYDWGGSLNLLTSSCARPVSS